MRKLSKLVIAIVLMVILLSWFMIQPSVELLAVRPIIQQIRVFVEEQAVTELPQTHLISMPVNGWLNPILLREGDKVNKNQIVARLEQDELKDLVIQAERRVAVLETQIEETSDNRLEENMLIEVNATVKAVDELVASSEASLKAANALRKYTSAELGRHNRLSQKNATTDSELKKVEMEALRARASYQSESLRLAALKTLTAVSHIGPKFVKDYVDRKIFTLNQRKHQLVEAKAVLEIEKRNLVRSVIKSPIDAIVLQRHQSRKQFLSAGTPLLTVGNLDDLEVIVEVLTERAMQIQPGDSVDIYGEGLPNRLISGKVTRIYPSGFKKTSSLGVEQQRVNVAIKLNHRPKNLGTGFRVYVRIYYDQSENATTIPRTCLLRNLKGGWNVLVVKDGVLHEQEVAVGLMNDDIVEINKGVTEKDDIILHPVRENVEGMKVTAIRE